METILKTQAPRSRPAPATDGPAPRSRRTCSARWTPTGAPPTTWRSGRSTSTTTRCSREPLKLEHVKPRLLGHWGTTPGQNFIYVHLNRVIKEYDLNMIYISGPGHGGPALVGNTYLEGTYSELYPERLAGRGRHEAAVPAVLLPRRHPQPRRPGDARLDPRGRRARLQPQPRLRRGLRQPRPDRGLRRRRRRGRDGPAGHRLALEQVPQPGARRGRAADPPPQRLQDRQPDRPGPHRARGARAPAARLRLHPALRRGARARGDAPAHGRDARPRPRRHPPHPVRCAGAGRHRAPALADDRPEDAQGLDRAEGRRRPAGRGDVPGASGAAVRADRASRAPEDPRGLDAQLQARGALRRDGPAHPRAAGAGPRGRAPDGGQPARQRRHPAPRPEAARLPRLRHRRAAARRAS